MLKRSGVLGVTRAETWDGNLPLSLCSLNTDPETVFYGVEIRYPPFDLGIESANTWKWMLDKYAGCVEKFPAILNFLNYLGLRRRSDELGRGFLFPWLGPLFSTTGVT